MRKYYTVCALTALLFSQTLFAADSTSVNSIDPDEMSFKPCEMIAHACLNAGFDKKAGPGKMMWHDCMKPILFKKSVAGVTVDPNDAKACREFKIKNLQEQIDQLKKA